MVQYNKPLVTVTIPTWNSEDVIGDCIDSVRSQSYPNVEILVIDSFSTDRTPQIAVNHGARVISYEGKLLGARYQGLLESRGKYLLLMDSDQILESTAIERAVRVMDKYDMLVLEEFSYQPKTWLQKLFDADRKLIHSEIDESSFDPMKGTLLPRFFKRWILEKVFEAIPKSLIPVVVHHDHAIIYLEAYKISTKVGVLPRSVYHREPHDIRKIWRRNVRYGKSLKELSKDKRYGELFEKRDKGFRKGFRSNPDLWIRSFLLLLLLKTAQKVGYWSG